MFPLDEHLHPPRPGRSLHPSRLCHLMVTTCRDRVSWSQEFLPMPLLPQDPCRQLARCKECPLLDLAHHHLLRLHVEPRRQRRMLLPQLQAHHPDIWVVISHAIIFLLSLRRPRWGHAVSASAMILRRMSSSEAAATTASMRTSTLFLCSIIIKGILRFLSTQDLACCPLRKNDERRTTNGEKILRRGETRPCPKSRHQSSTRDYSPIGRWLLLLFVFPSYLSFLYGSH